jgi:hypothetical protein
MASGLWKTLGEKLKTDVATLLKSKAVFEFHLSNDGKTSITTMYSYECITRLYARIDT